MKKILSISPPRPMHWVGNGFPVRSLFSYNGNGAALSPFLLLDHGAPYRFEPGSQKRGVGVHPHRGFETVTLVYQGEVDHRDSTGAGGRIGAGDVQWMTAGRGILHEEFHSEDFTRSGGTFEVAQLWVNLPAKHKRAEPGYQALASASIPSVNLPDDAGTLRVIAGEFSGAKGPARTFSPVHVWDAAITPGKSVEIAFTPGYTALCTVLEGTVLVNGGEVVRSGQVVHFEREGSVISLEANQGVRVLLLSGEPLDEPIAGHGPFVMNTKEEIVEAFHDLETGRFA